MTEWIRLTGRDDYPEEFKAIDLWQVWVDAATGEDVGRRVANCMFDGRYFLHNKAPVYGVTHWSYPTGPDKWREDVA